MTARLATGSLGVTLWRHPANKFATNPSTSPESTTPSEFMSNAQYPALGDPPSITAAMKPPMSAPSALPSRLPSPAPLAKTVSVAALLVNVAHAL
jgi:hypothetical protein